MRGTRKSVDIKRSPTGDIRKSFSLNIESMKAMHSMINPNGTDDNLSPMLNAGDVVYREFVSTIGINVSDVLSLIRGG